MKKEVLDKLIENWKPFKIWRTVNAIMFLSLVASVVCLIWLDAILFLKIALTVLFVLSISSWVYVKVRDYIIERSLTDPEITAPLDSMISKVKREQPQNQFMKRLEEAMKQQEELKSKKDELQ
jgi:ABC-type bacteriocin/lantibiotic exporter with double-glycine peptidase domain